jgi:hypothetical protein
MVALVQYNIFLVRSTVLHLPKMEIQEWVVIRNHKKPGKSKEFVFCLQNILLTRIDIKNKCKSS